MLCTLVLPFEPAGSSDSTLGLLSGNNWTLGLLEK
jgi:hypothetical protein